MEEETKQQQSDYDAEYDKLWDKANGIEPEEDTASKPDEDIEEPQTGSDGGTEEEPVVEPNVEQEDNSETVVEDENVSEEPKEKRYKLRAIDRELEFNEDEIIELAKKGIDYTKKTQWIAENKRRVELTKDIPEEILNALKNVESGNKEALVKIAKEYDIDMYDLDADTEPELKDYSTNPVANVLQEVEQRIMADTQTLPKVEQVLSQVPESFKKKMAQEPELLNALYIDVKNGRAETVLDDALKSYYVNGGDFLPHYQSKYQELYGNNVKPVEPSIDESRKKAVPPTTKTVNKKKDYLADAEEIWKMPSEDFAKIKAKIMNKYIQ